MKIIQKSISIPELKEMSKKMQKGLVKAVVDIERGLMAVDAMMHVDLEELFLEEESEQENLWGINIYPDNVGKENFVEFDSMINIRPSQGNCTRGVDDIQIQKKIKALVSKLVIP